MEENKIGKLNKFLFILLIILIIILILLLKSCKSNQVVQTDGSKGMNEQTVNVDTDAENDKYTKQKQKILALLATTKFGLFAKEYYKLPDNEELDLYKKSIENIKVKWRGKVIISKTEPHLIYITGINDYYEPVDWLIYKNEYPKRIPYASSLLLLNKASSKGLKTGNVITVEGYIKNRGLLKEDKNKNHKWELVDVKITKKPKLKILKPKPTKQTEQNTENEKQKKTAKPTNFKNCTELNKYYPNGVKKGHPAYQSKMDRDGDGLACDK